MLCGRLPFDDDHIPMLFKKINGKLVKAAVSSNCTDPACGKLGGIFSLPPYLSPGARHLLSRMLLVDSNKRITLAEIRQLPWFQEGLPEYLSQPARPSNIPGPRPSSPDLSQPGEGSSRDRLEAPGLGYLDMETVKDLCERLGSISPEDAVKALQSGAEKDKKYRLAYQLCDDHRKAKLAGTGSIAL